MKNRLIPIFFAAVMLLSLSLPAAAAATPSAELSSASARPGQQVSITLSLKNNPGIIGLRLQVSYDEDAMTLVGVTDSGALNGAQHGTDAGTLAKNPYTLFWMDATAQTNNTYNGVVATLTFLIKDSAPKGDYAIGLSYTKASDIMNYDMDDVTFSMQSSSISVGAPVELTLSGSGNRVEYTVSSSKSLSYRVVAAQYQNGRLVTIRMSSLLTMGTGGGTAEGTFTFSDIQNASYRVMLVNAAFVPQCGAITR